MAKEIYRITREAYASPLVASGKSARWNYDNQFVLYFGGSRSLSTLEMLAYRRYILKGITYKIITIQLDFSQVTLKEISIADLPPHWQKIENYHITQSLGNSWYQYKESLVLKVPSSIIPDEHNYILNTVHPDFSTIKVKAIEDYKWGERLL